MPSQPTYLVTVALPYANGPLHLGHLIEMLEADAWVRTKKMLGYECYFISGDDCHGTPIMIKAQQQGCTPYELVSSIHAQHQEVIGAFGISFDTFSRTDSQRNHQRCYALYERLKKSDLFYEAPLEQAFDPEKQMFLPDRFVKGICPRCDAPEQYGDNCEKCGATYNPQELKSAYSTLSGATPVFKTRQHLFADIKKYQSWLSEYLPSVLCPAVMAKMQEWLNQDLRAWNISRESPYHGIPIPDREGQYFYVWFDAPIGYLSAFDEMIAEKGLGADFWNKDNLKLVHFIGKDITYFHSLFWPVMLKAAGEIVPSHIYTHGFLTIQGQKMSKSKGLFLQAHELCQNLQPDLFRYYILSKMNGSIDDFNFDVAELCQKVNSDLVGKYLNILSRCAKLLFQHFDGVLCPRIVNAQMVAQSQEAVQSALALVENRQHGLAIQTLMRQVDLINESLTQQAPWTVLKKDLSQKDKAWADLSDALQSFAVITSGLQPFLPHITSEIEQYFAKDESSKTLRSLTRPYEPLLHRLDPQILTEKLFMNQNEHATVAAAPSEQKESTIKPMLDYIKIDDFARLDLRVGTILQAEPVEGSDKLLRFQIDVGFKTIQVFSGIKAHYDPAQLIGQQVIVCVNLEPRKMRFGLSEGMVLAASDEDGLSVLSPLAQRANGSQVS